MIYYDILCYAMLYYAIPYYTMLYYPMLHYGVAGRRAAARGRQTFDTFENNKVVF